MFLGYQKRKSLTTWLYRAPRRRAPPGSNSVLGRAAGVLGGDGCQDVAGPGQRGLGRLAAERLRADGDVPLAPQLLQELQRRQTEDVSLAGLPDHGLGAVGLRGDVP